MGQENDSRHMTHSHIISSFLEFVKVSEFFFKKVLKKFLRLHYGCADVADCFHRMRLSGQIRHFFCWSGVSNKYLKEIEGINISPHQTLWLMCCSLPTHWIFLDKNQLADVSSLIFVDPSAISLANLASKGAIFVRGGVLKIYTCCRQ